jgi:hypothetical protein
MMPMGLRTLAVVAIPVVVHLAILSHLWFDAPVWDDFMTLITLSQLQDAASIREWLVHLFWQHNDHRIALSRFFAWAWTEATGRMDFRALALLANLFPLGLLFLAWVEFRRQIAPIALGAAAWVLYNWSYYEAALESMAGLSNIGVVLAAFACLHFALRDGWAGAAAGMAAGILAAVTQGNGLFALPLAVVGCAATGRRSRAVLMALVAAALWMAYFTDYARPLASPSPMLAFSRPVETVRLFLVVLGGLVSNLTVATALGVVLLSATGWLLWRGRLWRSHPAVALWIAFCAGSVAAAAIGRVGLGVHYASRYAIYASVLLAIVVLGFWALYRPTGRRAVAALALAGAISFIVTAANWSDARDFSSRGRMLAKAVPAVPGTLHDPYYGISYPDPPYGAGVLALAEGHGFYVPRLVTVHPIAVRTLARPPGDVRRAGTLDEVRLEGTRILARGWTDIDAGEPGQALAIFSPGAPPMKASARSASRAALAERPRPERLLSGFLLEVEFATQAEAASALPSLCVYGQSPGRPTAIPSNTGAGCPAGT